VLLVDGAHQRCCRWQNLIDEDEDSLLWGKLDALADDIDELSDREVCWDQVLLLIDRCDIRLLYLLTDNLDNIVVSKDCLPGKGTERCSSRVSIDELTGIRSAYFCRMRSASALRFSNGCSSLNFERILLL
jgi:hypothetical protein